jgi:hypothetical protein
LDAVLEVVEPLTAARISQTFAGKASKSIMFTRFQTSSAVHVFDAPLIKIPPDTPGAMFLGAIGGAFEHEEEHLRSRLLQFAADLEVALQQEELNTRRGVGAFLVGLRGVINFLNSVDENSVCLYSYERAPSIEDLLDAFGNGGGADDWALEELEKKGEKGRKALLSTLKKKRDKRKLLAAISMLLIVFLDDQTRAAIQTFIDKCEPDIGQDASLLLAAYTAT